MSANKLFGAEVSIGVLVSNFLPPTIRMIRFVIHCAKILIGPTFFVGV